MKLKVKKLHPEAIIPRYATDGAACFDLHALGGGNVAECGSTLLLRTGLSFEIPKGHTMLIFSRSGHGFKSGVRLVNSVGVIDSDYRGEVAVKLINDGSIGLYVNHGDRIAQAMIIPVPQVSFEEVEELPATNRGAGGFGSTGSA